MSPLPALIGRTWLAGTRKLEASRLGSNEGQQLGIDAIGMGRAHAVRQLLVDLEGAALKQLRRQRCRVGYGHDLIIIAVHHERGYRDALQVLGKVGLREGLDAVVLRLGAAHHALAPPVADDRLRWLCTRPVVAVEWAARETEVELRSVRGEFFSQVVEHS